MILKKISQLRFKFKSYPHSKNMKDQKNILFMKFKLVVLNQIHHIKSKEDIETSIALDKLLI